MEWLGRSLVCDGAVVARPLDPTRLGDSDLREICLRMHVILETIEMPQCEGRLIPCDLFDAIDTLESMVLHGHPSPSGHSRPPRLAEWAGVIRAFGAYYCLAGCGPIAVDPAIYRELESRYNGAQQAERDAIPDRPRD
jgi:hypothetical protein